MTAKKSGFNLYNGISTASVALATMVIVAELVPPFKNWLAATFSHHWVGKAIIISVVFFLAAFAYKNEEISGVSSEKLAWYATLGSLAAIIAFFVLHYFL